MFLIPLVKYLFASSGSISLPCFQVYMLGFQCVLIDGESRVMECWILFIYNFIPVQFLFFRCNCVYSVNALCSYEARC